MIGIAYSTNIKVSEVSKVDDGELLALNMDVSGFSFMFVVYYHRPSIKHVDDFLRWYCNLMSAKTVIVGDFNLPHIDWSTQT